LPKFAALLHSIVLGGGRRIIMADLREVALAAGFENPQTLAATGNLIIASKANISAAEAESALEEGIRRSFGKSIDVIARTADAFIRIAAGNPFPGESAANGSLVAVRVMRDPLPDGFEEALEEWRGEGERVLAVSGDLWVSFAGQPSQSRLLSRLSKQHLGIGTVRNWNTVHGLAQMLER
jgi:uncharacterized protein (DUF1697 family)